MKNATLNRFFNFYGLRLLSLLPPREALPAGMQLEVFVSVTMVKAFGALFVCGLFPT